ncbi:predicted protein [Uncinocarpus reesii 1704]|uniref:Zn(2)-C6 fungal-type domain-containing protein n=1 Tax=Uncinocarpus reesii (strain UAMH 1704) TaxID=336963 RepID=C4JQN3_UNCRE|nr:uncharacterized protein UREG_03378 [Uncinocarpus reesii 1704]EEP78532.1 predicted protein [Uncinocarpus reesii 1704]
MDPLATHSASFIYRSAPGAMLDSLASNYEPEPPRKKLRKGTKSCVECRRRKIRCKFNASRPGRCDECFSRGVSCVDQENAPVESYKPHHRGTEPSYSLRERVAVLEDTVEKLVKQLGDGDAKNRRDGSQRSPLASESNSGYPTNCAPTPSESAESSDGQTEQAPLLSLFNNQIVYRSRDTDNDKHALQNLPAKNIAMQSLLFSVMPPLSDIKKIFHNSPNFQVHLLRKYDEFRDENLPSLLTDRPEGAQAEALGQLAKLLVFLVSIVHQLPTSFNYGDLQVPLCPTDFIDKALSALERTAFSDEDIGSTIAGMECIFFAGKYYVSAGRPRKAWRLFRRGIEFAQLCGLHLSTNRPIRPDDVMGRRRAFVWCGLVCSERYSSLILGLPYAVPDRYVLPHIEHLANTNFMTATEHYMFRICLFAGGIIDRNQDPRNISLSKTLELDQELNALLNQMPQFFSSADYDGTVDALICQFVHHFMQVMVHLPFILNSDMDSGSQYCRDVALKSARNCINTYVNKRLGNAESKFTVCKMTDFQMFTATIVLSVHLLGRSNFPEFTAEENASDWELLRQATQIFREISNSPCGSVAAQSANVLEMLYGCSTPAKECRKEHPNGCKVTIPYFGTFFLRPRNSFRPGEPSHQAFSPEGTKQRSLFYVGSSAHITPSTSTPSSEVTPPERTGGNSSPVWEDPSVSFGNILSLPNVDFDFGGISKADEMGYWRMDPSSGLDIRLDQGWNLDWLNPNDFPAP